MIHQIPWVFEESWIDTSKYNILQFSLDLILLWKGSENIEKNVSIWINVYTNE